MTLTLKEFLVLLEASKSEFTWGLDAAQRLRGLQGGRAYCPLTAVAKMLGFEATLERYMDGAKQMGMDFYIAMRVADAADNPKGKIRHVLMTKTGVADDQHLSGV